MTELLAAISRGNPNSGQLRILKGPQESSQLLKKIRQKTKASENILWPVLTHLTSLLFLRLFCRQNSNLSSFWSGPKRWKEYRSSHREQGVAGTWQTKLTSKNRELEKSCSQSSKDLSYQQKHRINNGKEAQAVICSKGGHLQLPETPLCLLQETGSPPSDPEQSVSHLCKAPGRSQDLRV